jgi:uncharacterized protein YeaO (DUF488 family)
MATRIYTCHIGRYKGEYGLDITVKSASGSAKAFAPTWDMVNGLKSGKLTWEAYTVAYLTKMRESYKTNRAAWDELLSREVVVLLCYCAEWTRCHRWLLAHMLEKCGAEFMGELGMCTGDDAL